MTQELWPLGSAVATPVRDGDDVLVQVRGLITAPAWEALHMRLARFRSPWSVALDDDALVAMTYRSATEAAVRGLPIRSDLAERLIVTRRHLRFALWQSELMRREGISCEVRLLQEQPAQMATAGA